MAFSSFAISKGFFQIEPHIHREYEFHYVVSGKAVLVMGTNQKKIIAGDFFCLSPGSIHCVKTERNADFIHLFFLFSPDASLAAIFSDLEKNLRNFKIYHVGRQYLYFFEKLKMSVSDSDPLLQKSAQLSLLAFLYEIVSRGARQQENSQQNIFNRTLNALYENVRGKITLTQLAEINNISPEYLSRCFKNKFGLPPIQFFTKIKIELALQYLRQQNIRIRDVAGLLGFEDALYFSRLFKKWTGNSPEKYRANIIRNDRVN